MQSSPVSVISTQPPSTCTCQRDAHIGSSKMRIAVVLHGFSGGGMERSMLRLALGLKGRGHAVEFVVKKRRGELADQVPSDIPVYETGELMYCQWRPPPKKAATKIDKILRKIRKWPRKTEKLVKISILRIYLLRSDPPNLLIKLL